MEQARPAGPADVDRCAALLCAARHEALGLRGGELLLDGCPAEGGGPTCDGPGGDGAAADPSTYRFEKLVERWIADDRRLVMVGEFAGTAVGFGTAHLGEPTDGGHRNGVIDACYVEPAARGVGVGSALLRAMIDWCAGRGCTGVDAPALPGDRATKQRLEAAGFSARLLVLHRRLP